MKFTDIVVNNNNTTIFEFFLPPSESAENVECSMIEDLAEH